MSDAEIITILIYFHFNGYRNFKHYYLFYVREHLRQEFPVTLSYNRFVEVARRVAVPLLFFIRLVLMGECTGISFVDSTCIPVCHNKRISRVKDPITLRTMSSLMYGGTVTEGSDGATFHGDHR